MTVASYFHSNTENTNIVYLKILMYIIVTASSAKCQMIFRAFAQDEVFFLLGK